MTLLREAGRDTQREQDSVRIERRAVEMSKALRLSAEYLLETHGTQYSPAILLKRAGRVMFSPWMQVVGRRMLDTTLISDDKETRVTLVSGHKNPRRSSVLHFYIEGMNTHLEMYRHDAPFDLPDSGSAIVKNGKDAPGRYRGSGGRYYEDPLELKKYEEVLNMVREKLEPSAPPTQNPQA